METRTARRSGFNPFLCDQKSGGDKSCRRLLVDDWSLVFGREDTPGIGAVLPPYNPITKTTPDTYWLMEYEYIQAKIKELGENRLSEEELAALRSENATKYDEYLIEVK